MQGNTETSRAASITRTKESLLTWIARQLPVPPLAQGLLIRPVPENTPPFGFEGVGLAVPLTLPRSEWGSFSRLNWGVDSNVREWRGADMRM